MLNFFFTLWFPSLKAFSYHAIGLMSGTSMDGIDAAFLKTDGEKHLEEGPHVFLPYSQEVHFLFKGTEFVVHHFKGNLKKIEVCDFETELQKALKKKFAFSAHQIYVFLKEIKKKLHTKKISYREVEDYSTYLHAQATFHLIKKLKNKKIDIIGYHGQTLFHNPGQGITLQMGNGKRLASLTKISVVNDFRSLDVKNKGQGAPLVPLYHQALARKYKLIPCAIVNCGGISNVTFVFDNAVMGFDTGPGNALIDLLVKIRTKETMDRDAKYGKKGKIHHDVLRKLLLHAFADSSYLLKRPPKSLDTHDLYLIKEIDSLSLQDGCATLAAFTVETICQSLFHVAYPPNHWILVGGGFKNPLICQLLKESLKKKIGDNLKVYYAHEIHWNAEAIEAQTFAFLAVRHLRKLPTSLPEITGVSHPVVGGNLC